MAQRINTGKNRKKKTTEPSGPPKTGGGSVSANLPSETARIQAEARARAATKKPTDRSRNSTEGRIVGKKPAGPSEKKVKKVTAEDLVSHKMPEKGSTGAPAWEPPKDGASVGDFLGNQDEKGNVTMGSNNPSTVPAGTADGGVADLHVIAFPDYGTKESDSPDVQKAKEEYRAKLAAEDQSRRASNARENNAIGSDSRLSGLVAGVASGMSAAAEASMSRSRRYGLGPPAPNPSASSAPDVTIPPGERPPANPASISATGRPGGGFISPPKATTGHPDIHSSMLDGTPHPSGTYTKKKIKPGGIGKL
jgi:hypothetical protein